MIYFEKMETAIAYSDLAELADKYDYFLLDCDGVLWVGAKAVKHSFEALDFIIQKKKKKVFLITNAT
jgi:4-nitrophenyl phosphatase